VTAPTAPMKAVRGRCVRLMAILAFTAAGMFAAGAPAQAAGPIQIVELMPHHTSNKCLDVMHASLAHGAAVVQGNCEHRRNQQWVPRSVGLNTFEFRALHSGMCLDVAHNSHAHAARVVQATCSGGLNQLWFRSGANPTFRFMPLHTSNMCLDVMHGSHAHAAPVVQGRCVNPGFNQMWAVIDVRTLH
jgi:hypothetical protein